jgi:hypothetical protein
MTMKLMSILAASVFVLVAALSLNASAAADSPAGGSTASNTPADAKVEKAAPQKKHMKRHSHVEEKTGFAPKAPEATPDKANAANDKTKHFHPRDGK